MAPALDDCPPELIESINTYLAATDIGSLRLVNRTLMGKATQDRFKSYFRTKTIQLSRASLKRFVEATAAGRLVGLVEDLTLTGIVVNKLQLQAKLRGQERANIEGTLSDPFADAEDRLRGLLAVEADLNNLQVHGLDLQLLVQSFRNIRKNGKTGSLKRLSLEVKVNRDGESLCPPTDGGSWKLIWKCAKKTLSTTLAAVAESGIPVDQLDIFNNTERCSIACNELTSIASGTSKLEIGLASLKALSISLSDRIIDETDLDAQRLGDPCEEIDYSVERVQRDIHELKAEVQEEKNWTGLAELLQLCSQLETLTIHFYSLSFKVLQYQDLERHRLLRPVANDIDLFKVKFLSLQGMTIEENVLLTIIRRSPIETLELENIVIVGGTFKTIFQYCTSNVSKLRYLSLEDLFEDRLIYFHEADLRASTTSRRDTAALVRRGEELREPIRSAKR